MMLRWDVLDKHGDTNALLYSSIIDIDNANATSNANNISSMSSIYALLLDAML